MDRDCATCPGLYKLNFMCWGCPGMYLKGFLTPKEKEENKRLFNIKEEH